jgi:type IX secretion system PorP/SprF family membrane protein
MMKKFILSALCMTGSLLLQAQEPHFSMFYQNPSGLNPALAGVNECIMRIGGIYRDQWRTVGKPYSTYSFFADARLQPYDFKTDAFGVGLNFVGDKAGTARVGSNDFKIISSYHKGFIKDNRLVVSLGWSLGFVNRTIDETKLYFGSQWMGDQFNSTLPSNEPFQKSSVYYFDMNAGLLTTVYLTDYTVLSVGAVLNHITQPRFSFFGTDHRIGLETTLHAGLNAVITPRTFIMPKVYLSMQEGSKELIMGFNTAYYPGLEPIYLGLWYRWARDITPVVGFTIKGFNLMLSYDVNISRFTYASKYHGGFEVSLIKNFLCAEPFFFSKDKYSKDGKKRCPVF